VYFGEWDGEFEVEEVGEDWGEGLRARVWGGVSVGVDWSLFVIILSMPCLVGETLFYR